MSKIQTGSSEGGNSAEQHQELESDREEMMSYDAIKIEREELRMIMQEAMAAGESCAMGNPLAAAALARSGGDIDENGEIASLVIDFLVLLVPEYE